MCVTCGPLELEVELLLDDSVKGFSRSISCGFEPDTGKFRRFNSTLRSLTANATCKNYFSLLAVNLSHVFPNKIYLSCLPVCPKASMEVVPKDYSKNLTEPGWRHSRYFRSCYQHHLRRYL